MAEILELLTPFMPYIEKYGLPLFIVVAVSGALIKAIVRPLRRQKAIEEVAELLRLTCVDEPTQELADLLDSFSTIGRTESLNHLMVGVVDDTSVVIGDYRYYSQGDGGSGPGSDGKTVRQTFVVLHSEELQAPDFCLEAENVVHQVMEGFLGKITPFDIGKDIDFTSYPAFSSQYFLKGADEAAIRARFQPDILAYFESHPGLKVEVRGGGLVFYRPRELVEGGEIQTLLAEAFEVFNLFRIRDDSGPLTDIRC